MTFKDKKNREWLITIDYGALERVKAYADFNLLAIADPMQAATLDGLKVLKVLYGLVQPQAENAGVTYEDFRSALDPDIVDPAVDGILEGLRNFCPSRLRPVVGKLQDKRKAFEVAALKQLELRLDQTDIDQLVAKMDKVLLHSLLSSPPETNAPPSLESPTSDT